MAAVIDNAEEFRNQVIEKSCPKIWYPSMAYCRAVLWQGSEHCRHSRSAVAFCGATQVRDACTICSILSLRMLIKACAAFPAFFGSPRILLSTVGMICQETPNLSLSQPHMLSAPLSVSFSQ